MSSLSEAFLTSVQLIISADPDLYEIIFLSMRITLSAVAIACLIGFPLGAALAVLRFPGRGTLIVLVNALMGLPPVVVGLTVYLLLSATGPFGPLRLLYTPAAMIAAQTILVTPIVVALTRQTIAELDREYDETLRAMHASRIDTIGTLLWDARFQLMTASLAGLGRALAEVGAVMIVGGNINHATRVMTTSIALETAKGELSMALALGIILVSLTIAINASAFLLNSLLEQRVYA
ncbi:MAG: ABC transporter permease [Rhodobacteraceae bacterium]|nr:ABC transporter permease [Paracoccaceae bacterium]